MSNTLEIQRFALGDKLKARRTPLSFDLEITARCNLNCRHCYINLPANDANARAIVNLCLHCPAHAHLETGITDGATPYFCAVAHARAEQLEKASSSL